MVKYTDFNIIYKQQRILIESAHDVYRKIFLEVKRIADNLEYNKIEELAESLLSLREQGGRLFFLGVGGSAGNASHAVNDFRKLCNIEYYAPTDNVSELTARTNDEGWDTVFSEWLKISKICDKDAILIFSVGGGNLKKMLVLILLMQLIYAFRKN